MRRRFFAGRYRIANGWRFTPIGLSPVFSDNAHPFLTASGISINFFRYGFYVGWIK